MGCGVRGCLPGGEQDRSLAQGGHDPHFQVPWPAGLPVRAAARGLGSRAGRAPVCPLAPGGPHRDPLTYRELLGFIKANLPLLGFPAALFGTHSLRIGGATQMALSGYSAAQIQAAGRWSSDCYLVYIRLGDAFFRSLASALSACSVALCLRL
jgi:hypothetical protein